MPIARLQRENVGRRADQTFGEKELDQLFAQSLDVEGVARREMLEALDRLRRTDERAGAAAHDVRFAGLLVDLAQSRRAADRAGLGEDIGLRVRRPLVEHDREHLRDDVAGALHHHRVADAHVLARDLVLVVQGGVGDDDAADGHGLELGDRRERAGAADLDVDRLDDRHRLLGWELVRDRPARRARDEAEPLLQREIVDLVDDAVDVVAERRPLLLDRVVLREHLRRPSGRAWSADWSAGRSGRMASMAPNWVDGEGLAHFAPGVGEKLQAAARRSCADRAGAASPRRSCADWRRSACRRRPGAR